MSNNVQGVNNNIKAGTCPHGLAPGACPVCSSSGAGTLRQSDRNRKIGEMTYHECAMIGNMMKARALAQKNHEANLKHHAANIQEFESVMAKMAEGMKNFAQIMSNNFLTKPIAFVINNIALPITNFVKNVPQFFSNLLSKLSSPKTLFNDITDKLAAVYGEAKAFVDKKISDLVKAVKSAFEGLFKIFKKNDADDEDTKIDDDKRIFNLKTIIHKVKEKFKKKKDKKK